MIGADDPKLLESIRSHEGYRRMPYRDSSGRLTVGYGLNLDAGIGSELAGVILGWQVRRVVEYLETYRWWPGLSSERQRALAEMAFQLGPAGFTKFNRMISAIEAGDFQQAAEEMLASRWHDQTPIRAEHCARLMRIG